jgi:TPR repeat protein
MIEKVTSQNWTLLFASICVSLFVLYFGGSLIWNRVLETELLETLERAKGGDIESQFILAMLYEDGIGVKINTSEAESWYRRSAENGNSNAQFMVCSKRSGKFSISLTKEQVEKWCKIGI